MGRGQIVQGFKGIVRSLDFSPGTEGQLLRTVGGRSAQSFLSFLKDPPSIGE